MKSARRLPLILIAFLSACTSQPGDGPTATDQSGFDSGPFAEISCRSQPTAKAEVKLGQVKQLEDAGRKHAALAELQASPMDSLSHWLRYAKLESELGNTRQAAALFERLGEACGSAEAWHKLGVIEIKQGKLIAGLYHLEAVVQQRPTNARVHNDYGYGLLLVGNYRKAIFQLRTALELSNGEGPARVNLMTAYLLSGNQAAVIQLASHYQYSKQETAQAHQLARKLRIAPVASTQSRT